MLVLSVSSLKGGVGKTSMTLGLASAAFSRGIPTLVVDVDPQADASTGLDVPVTTPVDVADVMAAPKSKLLDQAIVPSGWADGKKGLLDVIPGSPRAAEFDRPSLSERYLRRLREALGRVGSDYRLVLIDCPPSLNGLTRAAWTASDRVLVVTEPGLFSVAAADRALRATAELRRRSAATLQPLGILVNRVRPNSREHGYRIDELKEMFGPLVVNPQLPERTVLQQAQGSARPIHSWPGKPAAELASSFDKILDRVLRSEKVRGRKPAADEVAASGTAPAGNKPQAPGKVGAGSSRAAGSAAGKTEAVNAHANRPETSESGSDRHDRGEQNSPAVASDAASEEGANTGASAPQRQPQNTREKDSEAPSQRESSEDSAFTLRSPAAKGGGDGPNMRLESSQPRTQQVPIVSDLNSAGAPETANVTARSADGNDSPSGAGEPQKPRRRPRH